MSRTDDLIELFRGVDHEASGADSALKISTDFDYLVVEQWDLVDWYYAEQGETPEEIEENGAWRYSATFMSLREVAGRAAEEYGSAARAYDALASSKRALIGFILDAAGHYETKSARVFDMWEEADYLTNRTVSRPRPPRMSTLTRTRAIMERERPQWDPERAARMPRRTSSHHFSINRRRQR